jgi:hypothetical protein
LWDELLAWLSTEKGVPDREWKSTSAKYGWALLPKLKKRTIFYMGPCNGCFRVSFALGDRAVAAAQSSNLPKSVLKIIADAPKYAEGTGVRLIVRARRDLQAVRTLAEIKLAN